MARGNLMVASSVAVVTLIVIVVVGYLTVGAEPKDPRVMPVPTVTPPPVVVYKSSNAYAQNASHHDAHIAPNMPSYQVSAPGQSPTPSQTSEQAPSTTKGKKSGAWGNVPLPIFQEGALASFGGYTAVDKGSVVEVTSKSGTAVTLRLNGYLANWENKQRLSWIALSGCKAPILVWNAGATNGSAAFGYDGNGQYQAFASHGGTDLVPDGGDGSNTYEFGVYNKGDYVVFREKDMPKGRYDRFNRCGTDGLTLQYSGVGD